MEFTFWSACIPLSVLCVSMGLLLKLMDGSPFITIYKVDKKTFEKVKKDKQRIKFNLIDRR